MHTKGVERLGVYGFEGPIEGMKGVVCTMKGWVYKVGSAHLGGSIEWAHRYECAWNRVHLIMRRENVCKLEPSIWGDCTSLYVLEVYCWSSAHSVREV